MNRRELLTGMAAIAAEAGLPLHQAHALYRSKPALIAGFLRRTYQIVPEGEETDYIDFDAEITELLSQA